MEKFDAVVIGAGVVGLAVAAKLSKRFNSVLLVEKNARFGEETSSRNSEVIHAGLYYPTNSLKAKFCVEGKHKLYQYCQDKNIPFNNTGKLVVAHSVNEQEKLESIMQQGISNGVDDLFLVSKNQLHDLEPLVSAETGLMSPSSGIIDVHSYMQALLFDFEQAKGLYVANTQVETITKASAGLNLTLTSVDQMMTIQSDVVVNCAGLHAMKVAASVQELDKSHIPQLHMCRGHYFSYSGKSPFARLIYPIPENNGLGIHASIDIAGQIKFGPDTQYIDEIDYQVDAKLKEKFFQAIVKYFPSADAEKLQPAYSGIRPKLQSEHEGFKDFMIQTSAKHQIEGLVNLFGIDSPGLTSSLAIADYVEKII
ncbi:NAD(P)/FAD-dependent oxidoreductase [Thalassotalea marina]|uniref:FAD dependent oxidoreductase domain-containing protein n=1 Tax=Thalassotalea marina TaxID=1673741 RepID=A0A919BQW5_9GAMM|nr:NAD(P)/FAD-dependent oxidoreductase [Thalassotalea marina]GHG04047.1 hypothetical protein GCM10017161_36820 [Thalassotalea marina]